MELLALLSLELSLTQERVDGAREFTGVVWPETLGESRGVLSEC